jgi:hypothetical protein
LRLLVFLECDGEECEDDAKNVHNADYRHFHQVKLTPRQFKRVSEAIILREREDPELKPGYCIWNGLIYGIEVKSPTGHMNENQQAFKEGFENAGGIYVLARSLDDVQAAGL